MSTTTLDPVELLLNKADQGNLIIKNPNVLRHDYIPSRILHRDKQQELVTQALLPKINSTKPFGLRQTRYRQNTCYKKSINTNSKQSRQKLTPN